MDENTVEFIKKVVESDLDRDLIDVISDETLSFDERLAELLRRMEERK